jgi:hypothetical protein
MWAKTEMIEIDNPAKWGIHSRQKEQEVQRLLGNEIGASRNI